MLTVTVTAQFKSVAEATAWLAASQPQIAAAQAAIAAEPAPAAVKPKAEKPAAPPAPAAAASAPAPAASAPAASASKADVAIDYPTLQKAVFKLAGIADGGRDAATELLAQFEVKTFKDLAPDRWAEALAAVERKLGSLSVPA